VGKTRKKQKSEDRNKKPKYDPKERRDVKKKLREAVPKG